MKKVLFLLALVFVLTGCCPEGANVAVHEKCEYKKAVSICGVDNLEKNEYTNNSDDWSCADYSKAN